MPTGGGVAVRAEQVSRLCQMGSARIPALDVATLEVPAGEFLVPFFTCSHACRPRKNIELALRLAEGEPGERAQRVREALGRVRLEKRPSRRPSKHSGESSSGPPWHERW
jgi:hypothetical protein